MSNMSYCRFENTLDDLRDCEDNLHDPKLSADEKDARRLLLKTAARMLRDWGYEVVEPEDAE